jgi:hypothetical protein
MGSGYNPSSIALTSTSAGGHGSGADMGSSRKYCRLASTSRSPSLLPHLDVDRATPRSAQIARLDALLERAPDTQAPEPKRVSVREGRGPSCRVCKARKIKVCPCTVEQSTRQTDTIQCDGARPACQKCILWGRNCSYPDRSVREKETEKDMEKDTPKIFNRYNALIQKLEHVQSNPAWITDNSRVILHNQQMLAKALVEQGADPQLLQALRIPSTDMCLSCRHLWIQN